MASLKDKLTKHNKIKGADLVADSKFFVEEYFDSGIPLLNLAFSAKLDGGFTSGFHLFAGDSKAFKTIFCLLCLRSFLEKNDDAMGIVYDCEGGFSNKTLESVGIDPSRVFHKPIESIEEMNHDMVTILDDLDPKDKLAILVDSYALIASDREVSNAQENNSALDMTRAKQLNGHFRIMTPKLRRHNVPVFGVAGTYDTQTFMPSKVLAGGKNIEKSCNSICLPNLVSEAMDTSEKKGTFFRNVGRIA